MFSCVSSITNKKITTTSYLDCDPDSIIEFTASEFAKIANTSSLTLDDVFLVPAIEDLQTVFMSGFSLPIVIYLTAWAFSTAINFTKE